MTSATTTRPPHLPPLPPLNPNNPTTTYQKQQQQKLGGGDASAGNILHKPFLQTTNNSSLTATLIMSPRTSSTLIPPSPRQSSLKLASFGSPLDPLLAGGSGNNNNQPFDAISFVNQRFPDDASLANVEVFAGRLETRITQLDDELALAVRAQAQLAGKALADLDVARKAVGELHAKIKGIRSKAEDSEARVEAVCRDITRLDRAKTNLTETMKALERASGLLTLVDQLEFFAESKQYGKAAELLSAANQLNAFFEGYDHVPKLKEMRNSLAKIKDTFTRCVTEEIRDGLGLLPDHGDYMLQAEPSEFYYNDERTIETLKGACAVAELLSKRTKEDVRKLLLTSYLRPYEQLFALDREGTSLDNIDRRFSWLEQTLNKNHIAMRYIFPHSWRMEELFVASFCSKTVEHLKTLLDQSRNSMDDSAFVKIMRKAFKLTLDFELKIPHILMDGNNNNGNGDLSHTSPTNNNNTTTSSSTTTTTTTSTTTEIPVWKGIISEVFQQHMKLAVTVISRAIEDSVDNVMVDEFVNINQPLPVNTSGDSDKSNLNMDREFKSASDFLNLIQLYVNDLVKLNNGQIYVDFLNEMKRSLIQYADKLERRAIGDAFLKQYGASASSATGSGLGGPRGGGSMLLPASLTTDKPLDQSAARQLCVAINTCHYMSEAMPKLCKYTMHRASSEFASKIDFNPEQDRFLDAASRIVGALSTRLVSRMDVWLGEMAKVNWLTFKDPGDRSVYVRQMHSVTMEMVPFVNQNLKSSVYFRSFCDSFASLFLKSLAGTIAKLKRVGEQGATQLLVDVSAIEQNLLQLSDKQVVRDGDVSMVMYKRFVEQGMKRHKMLFKVLGMQAPIPILVENFSTLLGPSRSLALLDVVLDLKGIVRSDERRKAKQLAVEAGVPPTSDDDVLEDEEMKIFLMNEWW